MNFFKKNIPKQITLLTLLVIVLVIIRIFIFNSFSLIYILWNIFLAIIPFIISLILLDRAKKEKLSKILLIIGSIIWILFLPNAPYLVTDLIHIGVVRAVPALYDSFLLFSSAWVGMLLLMHSLFHMEKIISMRYVKWKVEVIISVIILLTSFGVYIGRFLRFNSWDIFIDNSIISKNVWIILSQPTNNLEVFLYTALFFLFIFVSYVAWKNTKNLN
jgi:uncharacterized membrane protein